MRLCRLLTSLLLTATSLCFGQHYPVLPVAGSPHGIYTLMQDSKSRIWMGTIDDVLCFDGTRFYSLRQYGFPKEITNALAEDSDGDIWIGTQGADYIGNAGHGGLYVFRSGRVEKIFSTDVLSIARVASGVMIASFGTEASHAVYGDLYRFLKGQEGWKPEQLSQKLTNHITIDHQGTALFPCPGGWCELSRQQVLDWRVGGIAPQIQKHTGDPAVERVLRDKFGCLWWRTEVRASYQCAGDREPIPIPENIAGADSSAHLQEAGDGSIFIGGALGRPDAFRKPLARNGIPTNLDFEFLATDGTIWYGADAGLYRFMYPFHLEFWNPDNGLDYPGVIQRAGDKIITNSVEGILALDSRRIEWSPLDRAQLQEPIGDLMAEPNGHILALTSRGVVEVQKDGTILARSAPTQGMHSLARTGDGQIWVGGKVISRVVRRGRQLILLDKSPAVGGVTDLKYDNVHDALWACDGRDLQVSKNGHWRRLTATDGVLSTYCRSIAVDLQGDVWEGYVTSAKSLIQGDPLGPFKVRNYKRAEFGSTAYTDFFGVDRRGWLWRASDADYVATPRNAEEDAWLRLDTTDGIPKTGGMNTYSFFSDLDNSVWFASGSTIVHFDPPDGFATDFPSPTIFMSGFSSGKDQPVLAEEVKAVPHGQSLTAHVGTLQFDRRNAIQLRYRLLPEQSVWQTGEKLDLALGKLHWGRHTLQVQSRLSIGPWSETIEQSFVVERPIWLTWPVLLGVVVVATGILAGGRSLRKQRQERAKRVLPDLAAWRLTALSPELRDLDGVSLDGRFEIGQVLARGGFATVVAGRDQQHDGRPCAIKIFRHELMDKEWMTRRFEQEVLALATIDHPNVVRVYGHGTTPTGLSYLVMEFVEGRTLREVLESGSIDPRRTASYLRQTGSALDQIHARGICHRDLKPDNLMIRDASPPGHDLVLIDFSIAIVQDPDETLHGLSRAAGTIYYMAPEQAVGWAVASTDIYSLAKVLIEMLTGKRLSILLPDASMDLPARVRELLGGLRFALSTSSIELISSALEFDPSNRPKDAGAFSNLIAQELESITGME